MSVDKAKPKAAAAAVPKPKSKKRMLLIIGAVVVLGLVGGGVAWFMAGKSKGEDAAAQAKGPKVPAPAQYFALEPAFVVNLAGAGGSSKYLQVEVQLMTRDPQALADIERHSPALRARLLMLFSQEDADALVSRAGKEKLQAAALAEVRKVLVAETGKPGPEALMFTSFVMQ